jgi:hypothetical protein
MKHQIKRQLVKASGDLRGNEKAIAFVGSLSSDNPLGRIVFVPGGGSYASALLAAQGHEIQYDTRFTPPRRKTKTLDEKLTVATVLVEERDTWAVAFADLSNVEVISPFQWPAGLPVNTNGDDLVWLWFTEFDETYILTLADRVESKRKIFGKFPEIQIIPF